MAAQEGLQGQDDAALCPTLHGSQVVLGVLGHAVGKAPVDELRTAAQEHRLQAAGGVLHLTALVEHPALDHVRSSPAVDIPHALLLRLPNGGVVAVLDHPRAVGPAGAHTPTTVADHAVKTEESGVVVVQVVQLVLHLVEVLGALGESDVRVQLAELVVEVRQGRVKEVLLELVPGVADAEKARGIVPVIAVEILRPLRVDCEVVLAEVQASGFAAAGAQRHVEVHVALAIDGVHILRGICPQGQPVLHARVWRDPVVPRAGSHMLRRHSALIFEGLGPSQVVHAQRQARLVRGPPVFAVVPVDVELRALLLPQGHLQVLARTVEG
mmetsp:Transcript_130213/g.362777  ORF Transcript_130213/g.362777 Transcript_130213/m.362777 type:complete len:326 (-) Transcript_130213:314-1291(-)